jgi:predicted DNA-binding protein
MEINNTTTIILPMKLKTELRIMCALTNKRMSDFIRIAIQDKIKELNEKRQNTDENRNES